MYSNFFFFGPYPLYSSMESPFFLLRAVANFMKCNTLKNIHLLGGGKIISTSAPEDSIIFISEIFDLLACNENSLRTNQMNLFENCT